MTRRAAAPGTVLIAGASGYVGTLVLDGVAALASGVRCMTRRPERLLSPLPKNVEVVAGDVLDAASLTTALAGIDTALYLVHGLSSGAAFTEVELQGARNFAAAARAAGVQHIVYLGALSQPAGKETSAHIFSRHAVGEALRNSGVPVTEFRASVIIGSGSMPFEVVRALVERLPVMVTPRWVRNSFQPLAESDLRAYLLHALIEFPANSAVYEIGGAEATDYLQLMREYGRQRRLRRLMLPVPFVTPRLSSLWLGLVTPAHFRIGRRIVDSASHPSVVRDRSALDRFPEIHPVGLTAAVRKALDRELERLWDDIAVWPAGQMGASSYRSFNRGACYVEQHTARLDHSPEAVFRIVAEIGGDNGWYWEDWLWRLRGALDRVVGGPGLRRSSGAKPGLRTEGQQLDFWHVEQFVPGVRMRLRADMRLPGQAWLELSATGTGDGKSILTQTAVFNSRGVGGMLYWNALLPLHRLVFSRMFVGLAERSAYAVPSASTT